VLALAACTGASRDSAPRAAPPGAASTTDDFGDTLSTAARAERIVSLNPVATEALFAMGAGGRVVGRTHWDATSPEAQRVADLGNGIQPNVEAVLAVRPDLIVLYASPSNRAAAASFRRAGVQTLTLRTDHIADFERLVVALGGATGDSLAARAVVDSVRQSLAVVRAMDTPSVPPSVYWYVWDEPVITIGAGSYLDELLQLAKARNVFGDLPQPSPQVTLEAIAQRNPDFVVAGPTSAARLRRDARWQAVEAVRRGRVLVYDTTLFARPGVRLGEAAHSLRALIDSAVRARQ
jgi:ABC-type Fe3+-hydroxamate transport system substrate-binding protein